MSVPLVGLLLDLLRDHLDDPAPVATADYIDASMSFEQLEYEPYRLRLHLIQLRDSLLITRVEKHPGEPENRQLSAFFGKMKRYLILRSIITCAVPHLKSAA